MGPSGAPTLGAIRPPPPRPPPGRPGQSRACVNLGPGPRAARPGPAPARIGAGTPARGLGPEIPSSRQCHVNCCRIHWVKQRIEYPLLTYFGLNSKEPIIRASILF
jgi:hypothetical protein